MYYLNKTVLKASRNFKVNNIYSNFTIMNEQNIVIGWELIIINMHSFYIFMHCNDDCNRFEVWFYMFVLHNAIVVTMCVDDVWVLKRGEYVIIVRYDGRFRMVMVVRGVTSGDSML